MYRNFFKRLLDFSIALIALVLLMPILLIFTLLLFIANKGKPFFIQKRPGLHGEIFQILKFKTMNDATDVHGQLLPDAERLTTVGNIVRKTSVDELPQLLNVLKGDMSLIGPRPLLPQYLEYYNEAEMSRLSVRPGITGLTGILGRNDLSWKEKMQYDIDYVNNLSFQLDLKIFFKTIKKIIIKEGVNKAGFATTDTFIDYCNQNPERVYDNKRLFTSR